MFRQRRRLVALVCLVAFFGANVPGSRAAVVLCLTGPRVSVSTCACQGCAKAAPSTPAIKKCCGCKKHRQPACPARPASATQVSEQQGEDPGCPSCPGCCYCSIAKALALSVDAPPLLSVALVEFLTPQATPLVPIAFLRSLIRPPIL
jgi:hypothetical protein